jgi:hypothetical protein
MATSEGCDIEVLRGQLICDTESGRLRFNLDGKSAEVSIVWAVHKYFPQCTSVSIITDTPLSLKGLHLPGRSVDITPPNCIIVDVPGPAGGGCLSLLMMAGIMIGILAWPLLEFFAHPM